MRNHKAAAIFFGNGSQRGVTDLTVQPLNGLLQTSERLARFAQNGSLRCGSAKLSIRSPPDEAWTTDLPTRY